MDLPRLHRAAELRAAGVTPEELRRLRRAGEVTPVRRGTKVAGAPPGEAELRHMLAVLAAARDLSEVAVFSHVSAAVVLGLPVWGLPLDRVTVTRSRSSGGRIGTAAHVRTAPLSRDDVVDGPGVRLTTPPRTVVDIARTAPFPQAVAVADATLHLGLVTPGELADAVAAQRRWPGCPAARRAVAFADGRADGVGESRSRVAIARAGLPAPVLQWDVEAPDGRLLGRVDFAWPGRRVVGEFDGRIKYGRLLRAGQEPGDAVFAEKVREGRHPWRRSRDGPLDVAGAR